MAARSPTPWICSGSAMASSDGEARVERGEGILEDDLNVTAHPPQVRGPFSSVSSVPSNLTEPEVGRVSCSTERPVVDFPQPDSPTRPSVSPGAMVKETPRHGVDLADLVAHERAAAQREVLDQVGDLEQRCRRGRRAAPVRCPFSVTRHAITLSTTPSEKTCPWSPRPTASA